MNAQPARALDFDELLQMEHQSQVRHESIGGQLYAMAGGTPRHAHIIANLTTAVHGRLRGRWCRGASGDQRVRVWEKGTNWYYPDFLITCPPHRFHPRDKNALLNPHAIFEVLSPETEKFDRTKKFDEFKSIAELSDYILIDTQSTRIEHYQRLQSGAWTHNVYTLHTLHQEMRLDYFGISVPLAEIYEDVEVSEQGVLPIALPEIE